MMKRRGEKHSKGVTSAGHVCTDIFSCGFPKLMNQQHVFETDKIVDL